MGNRCAVSQPRSSGTPLSAADSSRTDGIRLPGRVAVSGKTPASSEIHGSGSALAPGVACGRNSRQACLGAEFGQDVRQAEIGAAGGDDNQQHTSDEGLSSERRQSLGPQKLSETAERSGGPASEGPDQSQMQRAVSGSTGDGRCDRDAGGNGRSNLPTDHLAQSSGSSAEPAGRGRCTAAAGGQSRRIPAARLP